MTANRGSTESLRNSSSSIGCSATYSAISQRKDRWNYLLGFNWDLNKSWSVMAEAGFGESRENFIAGVTYRY